MSIAKPHRVPEIWKTIAEGHVPTRKYIRDVSVLGEFDIHSFTESADFVFMPSGTFHHFTYGGVKNGVLNYAIRASEDRAKFGSGHDIFMTLVNELRKQGKEIHTIEDVWPAKGAMTTNNHQFWNAIDAGKSPELASANTFTGKMAASLGLTQVIVPPEILTIIRNNERDKQLEMIFRQPDWGHENTAWKDYANRWVSSMGHDGQAVARYPIKDDFKGTSPSNELTP